MKEWINDYLDGSLSTYDQRSLMNEIWSKEEGNERMDVISWSDKICTLSIYIFIT